MLRKILYVLLGLALPLVTVFFTEPFRTILNFLWKTGSRHMGDASAQLLGILIIYAIIGLIALGILYLLTKNKLGTDDLAFSLMFFIFPYIVSSMVFTVLTFMVTSLVKMPS
jgi:hypothetical protein